MVNIQKIKVNHCCHLGMKRIRGREGYETVNNCITTQTIAIAAKHGCYISLYIILYYNIIIILLFFLLKEQESG